MSDTATTEIRRVDNDPPANLAARAVRAVTGAGPAGMGLYWLANRAPNMVYVSAIRL